MQRMLYVLALAAVGAVGCQSSSTGSLSQSDMSPNDATISRTDGMPTDAARGVTDQQFVSDAGAAGMYEVKAGQIAAVKGSTARVQAIGQQMVTDHTQANTRLLALEPKKGGAAPPAMTDDQKAMIDRLNSASGADFDREYLKQQEAAHRQAILMFETESKGGRDTEVRAFATDTLPTLRNHLQMITGQEGDLKMGMDR